MKYRSRTRTATLAITVALAILSMGCTQTIIADAARSSLAAFLNGVFTNTVNSALNNP